MANEPAASRDRGNGGRPTNPPRGAKGQRGDARHTSSAPLPRPTGRRESARSSDSAGRPTGATGKAAEPSGRSGGSGTPPTRVPRPARSRETGSIQPAERGNARDRRSAASRSEAPRPRRTNPGSRAGAGAVTRPDRREESAGTGRAPRVGDFDAARRPIPAPSLPDEATLAVLHPSVREAVHSLGGQMSAVVGRHLAAAGLLVDEDPELALLHAAAAKARAPRLAEVREAVGIAAYAAGQFALARSELRAARRMTDAPELLPLLADCERALGHPERALEVAADPSAARLATEERIELAIVISGARRDLGEPDAALHALDRPELHGPIRDAAGLRLRYAYAEALLAAGRSDEAVDWFTQVATADDDDDTDAWERLHELRGQNGGARTSR